MKVEGEKDHNVANVHQDIEKRIAALSGDLAKTQ